MGEAKRKLELASKATKFDFGGSHMVVGEMLRQDPSIGGKQKAVHRATRNTISHLVGAKYGNSMDRHEGKIWAAWQEIMDEEDVGEVEVTRGMVDWLWKIAMDSDIKTIPAIAQWREALVTYLESLRAEPVVE